MQQFISIFKTLKTFDSELLFGSLIALKNYCCLTDLIMAVTHGEGLLSFFKFYVIFKESDCSKCRQRSDKVFTCDKKYH